MSLSLRQHASAIPEKGAFAAVLGGINGSRPDAEVLRQAAMLAGRTGRLTLLAVTYETGAGVNASALLSRRHAERSLRRAQAAAHKLGIDPEVALRASPVAADVLVAEAAQHDLLVIGTAGAGRVQGIAVHRTASVVLHTARGPVLVARTPPDDRPFPSGILLAVDGSGPAARAASIAAAIAGSCGSPLTIAAPSGRDAAVRRGLAEQAAVVEEATGTEPVFIEADGAPVRAVLTAAQACEASLIVIGSRRLRGMASLRSVSERVAHEAACSVLVAR